MSQQPARAVADDPVEIYDTYLVPSLLAPLVPTLLERAAPQPGERILDVACGTGAAARGVAPLVGPAGTVVGLDINPAMLSIARARSAADGTQIEWREGSAEDLPFAGGSFDLVLCQQGFQYFADRAAAAHEMHRVLAPSGRIAVAVWSSVERFPFDVALNAVIERKMGRPVLTTPYSLGDPRDLRALLEGAGFRDIVIDPFDFTARFAEPDRYVKLFVLGAATVLPEFAEMGEAELDELVQAVRRDAVETIAAYTKGDVLVMPNSARIAVARS